MRRFTVSTVIWFGAFLLIGLSGAPAWSQQANDAAKAVVGMWRLVEVTTNGQVSPDRGAHPTGFIVYDKSGNMSVQIMPDRDRGKFSKPEATADEMKAALLGYTAYFGTYIVDPQAKTVTHHRKGNIVPGAAVDVVRRYEFVGTNRMTLRPVENNNALTWERVD